MPAVIAADLDEIQADQEHRHDKNEGADHYIEHERRVVPQKSVRHSRSWGTRLANAPSRAKRRWRKLRVEKPAGCARRESDGEAEFADATSDQTCDSFGRH